MTGVIQIQFLGCDADRVIASSLFVDHAIRYPLSAIEGPQTQQILKALI